MSAKRAAKGRRPARCGLECDGANDCCVIRNFLRDPRLKTLTVGARLTWLELTLAMSGLGSRTLRFGTFVPAIVDLANLVGIETDELEIHLKSLIEKGLLKRAPDDALCLPVAPSARRPRPDA
jgi:hypothetical protein